MFTGDTDRREQQITALYELWRGLPGTDAGGLLQRITERAATALDGHTCSLILRERGGDTLRVAASVGLPQDVADSVTLMVGERIAGRVAGSGQPLLLNKDPVAHPLLAATGDRPEDITVRPEIESALCAPLVGMDGEVTGVLCLSRFAPAAPFTEADLRIFCLFAAQAGASVAHTRTVEDLTRAAREAAAMEREMARNSNLAALGQLAATVAHELRNPLSSIKGAAQFLLRECEGGVKPEGAATLNDFLSIVVDEVDGLGRLTTDLLEFARPTPPQRAPHDLREIIQAEVTFLTPELIEMGVTDIEAALQGGGNGGGSAAAFADVDPAQVGRALRNLLLNAAQAATNRHQHPSHARVRVALERTKKGANLSQWALMVEDNGPGVPPEMRLRLWEPFYTTKARGTGLGLAQVRQVAAAHGGEAAITDSPTLGGARFILLLPATDRPVILPS